MLERALKGAEEVSHLLYTRRVFWDGRKGCITVGGVYRNVTTAPVFLGIDEIDYAPEVGCMQLRPENGQMREMWTSEVAAVEKYLESVQMGGPEVKPRGLSIDGSEVS